VKVLQVILSYAIVWKSGLVRPLLHSCAAFQTLQ
jgi:hypothetical protein